MRHLPRSLRAVAAVAATALLLAACGGDTATDTGTDTADDANGDASAAPEGEELGEFRVGLVCGGLTPFTGLVAIHQDTFPDGLEVEQVCFDSGGDGVAALIGGSIEVFLGSVEHVVSTRVQGLPTQALAVINQRMPYWLLTPADTPFETLDQAEGETIAVTRPGSLSDTQLQAAALQVGVDYDSFEVIEAGSGATMVAALSTGAAVAGMVSEPNLSELTGDGSYRVLWEPDFDFVSIVAITNGDRVSDREAAYAAFVEGLLEAYDRSLEDVEFAVDAIREEGYEVSDEVLTAAVESAISEQPEGLVTDEAVYESTTGLLVDIGVLDEADVPAFDDVFDLRFTERS